MSSVEPTIDVPTGPTKLDHGYGLARVYGAPAPAHFASGPGRVRVRVDIERNAYDHQSHYTAYVWTPDGRRFLTSISPFALDMTALPLHSQWDTRRSDCIAAVEAIASQLVRDTFIILIPDTNQTTT